MKKLPLAAATLLLLLSLNSKLHAQGTSFTYQGRLHDGANPANGTYDLCFGLWDSPSGGSQQGGLLTNSATAVTNGFFTVSLDFGDQFPGDNRWLEIGVRTNGADSFSTLSPRQQVTPSPYAIFAGNASNLLGTLSASQLVGPIDDANLPASPTFSGTLMADGFAGDGSLLTSVNAATLGGLGSASFWQVGGNANANPTNGAYLGTSDNLPLELRVGGGRALRLEYALDQSFNTIVPNLIGGYGGNSVGSGVVGATVIGGGDLDVPNRALAEYATVLGGLGNTASGAKSVAMGNGSFAAGDEATAMGHGTYASGDFSTSTGNATTASGFAALAMGYKSYANGETSLAAGNFANAAYDGSFVWGDESANAYFSDTGPNQFLIRAAGGVGIGTSAPPPGGLLVASGGLAVTGASSPNYGNAAGVFIEDVTATSPLGLKYTAAGAIYAFNYASDNPLPLVLNTPGGNVGIGTTTPAYPLQVVGTCAATTFVTSSDKSVKENFQPVSAQEVLEKVASLPVTRWNFKGNKSEDHIGPMAQDFYAAFNVGPDDKHIATVDEEGVALAAIQGLNQKLEQQRAENAELKARLAKLEQLVSGLSKTGAK